MPSNFIIKTMPRKRGIFYTGVTFSNKTYLAKPFLAQINKTASGCGKNIYIGYFSDYHDAAEAYNAEVIKRGCQFAKLNVIDRSMPIPDHYKFKEQKLNNVNLSVRESIDLIKSNTNDRNRETNRDIIMYLSGRKNGIAGVIKKHYFYWLATIRKKQLEYDSLLSVKRKYASFTYTHDDIISESVLQMLDAIKRGKFDGRRFRQWSTQVVRNKMITMHRLEMARKVEKKKNAVQDFDYDAAWGAITY